MHPLTRGSRGSVLLLMPAAVLIVLLLGAVSVDSALVYLRQRQAYNVAFDAANDAASAGIDLGTARSSGLFVYDPDRVAAIATETVEAAGMDGLRLLEATSDGTTVRVTVEVVAHRLFTPVFGSPTETLRITATADGVLRPG